MSTEYHQIMTECVIALRMGLQGNASRKLIDLIDHVSKLLEVNSTLPAPKIQRQIAAALRCQEANDYIGLADIIEFEISPMLVENK
ncbi:MAG: hypothetical protein V3V31_05730 [Methylococcales bacterium]